MQLCCFPFSRTTCLAYFDDQIHLSKRSLRPHGPNTDRYLSSLGFFLAYTDDPIRPPWFTPQQCLITLRGDCSGTSPMYVNFCKLHVRLPSVGIGVNSVSQDPFFMRLIILGATTLTCALNSRLDTFLSRNENPLLPLP
jgi:hypothetical protein